MAKIITINQALLVGLLALMPIGTMTGATTPSIIYYLSLASALVLTCIAPKKTPKVFLKTYGWLIVAMALPVLVTLFSGLWHTSLSSRDLETALRWLLAVSLILLGLQSVPKNYVWHVVWGYLVAALLASLFIFYLAWPSWERPDTKAVYNAVIYGNLLFTLIVTAFFSLPFSFSPWPRAEKWLKWGIGLFSFAAFVLTQTRTAWLAVPPCVIIAALLFSKRANPRRILKFSALLLGLFILVFVSNPALRERAVIGYQELVQCQGEGKTTESSLCIRLQLWRASFNMAKERPIAGTGNQKLFTQTMQEESLPQGIVTPYVSQWWEPHSDLMLALATFGWPGGLAMLLIYLAPAAVFTRRLSFKYSQDTRAAAAIGLAICISFFAAGFGDTMFRIMRIASFYALSLVVFLRLSQTDKTE